MIKIHLKIWLIYYIIKSEIGDFGKNYKEFVDVILELAIQNELYTRISGKSSYLQGDKTLTFLKRQIYPYWLMYLGYEKSDMEKLFVRDNIFFDINNLPENIIDADRIALNNIFNSNQKYCEFGY